EDQAAAQLFGTGGVQAELVRDQVGVRQEVLARDLSLPPRAPVAEPGQQRIERLVLRRDGIVPLEERVAIRKRRLPGDRTELVGCLQRPRVRIERVAVPFRRVLELDRQVGGCRYG